MPKKMTTKQDRYTQPPETLEGFFIDVMRWVDVAGQDEPPYVANSRTRDTWLYKFWKLEPHLAGLLSSVVSIDSNRGWSLTGGRNQTLRFSDVFHSWVAAPGLKGWRPGAASASQCYYSADLGWVLELGRAVGPRGPLRELYHLDPTRCRLSGDPNKPLIYYPRVGNKGVQYWRYSDFLRGVSMPSILEEYNGLGFCAVSRALELAKIMVAIYQHDREQLGAQAPRGLLLIKGIKQSQFKEAMAARKDELEGEGWRYYSAVHVLANQSTDIDAKLVALSNLPAGFDLQKFTSLLMYGYALCFGFDPSEFYPVQFGSLGRGTEMEIQHEKATAKGQRNFVFSLQEQLQRADVLPPTLLFEFDERDEQGQLAEAAVAKAWADVIKTMRETGGTIGAPLISQEEARVLSAERDLIPREWAQVENTATASDEESPEALEESPMDESPEPPGEPTEPAPAQPERNLSPSLRRVTRDRLLSYPAVLRAAERFPNEPVVRYRWPAHRLESLWSTGGNLLRRRSHIVLKPKRRQGDGSVLWTDGELSITEADVMEAIKSGRERVGAEFGSMIDKPPEEDE